jgi:hypothetical protein
LLARLGLTPQKPLQRAHQRNQEAIERWKRERYPAIAQETGETQADLYFRDESEFRADAVQGKTQGVKTIDRLEHFIRQKNNWFSPCPPCSLW